MTTEASPTSDERLMAALAHFFGPIVALIVWATQKDKSRFVRFQSVQALAFDLTVVVVAFVVIGCFVALVFGTALLGTTGTFIAANQNQDSGGSILGLLVGLTFFLPFLAWCPMMILVISTLVARVIAAISVFQGKDFRYPVLGARVEKFLG
ncbi:MAG: DUF4870 domain-containing protein [Chloroflexi bacterium]|nr:DUF4870 domain-containing protein [Chloroflexota bacterium]